MAVINPEQQGGVGFTWAFYPDGFNLNLFKLINEYAATPIKEREDEKRYRIPLPNLKTSDGYQQYLSRKSKRNGHWFASRRQSNLIQAFTKKELEQVPEAYKQDAVEVEADENN